MTSPLTPLQQLKSTISGPFYQFHPTLGGRFKIIQGQPRFPIYNDDHLNSAFTQHSIERNDLVICSFYKTGTHWMKKILLEIMKHHPLTKDVDRFQSINISSNVMANLDTMPVTDPVDKNPRIYHSHLHYQDFVRLKSIHNRAKLIYLTRNPKDVAVSMHSMSMNIPLTEYSGDYQTSIELFLNGFTQCGDYWDHVKCWNDVYNEERHNLLWIYYEDLIVEPVKYIKLISKHIGMDKEMNEEQYQSIHSKVRFNAMKQELVDNPGNFYEELDLSPEVFFRSGRVGDWLDHFDEKMSHYYDVKTLVKWNKNKEIKYYQQLFDKNNKLHVTYD